MSEQEIDIHKLQELELAIYDEFARVCEKNDIPFMLAYGTLLGAVRHKGFIPWDDDIDVFVWAKDLPRLHEAMARDLNPGFFWQYQGTDPDFNMCFPRLRLDGTCALEAENLDRDIHHGVWIDVYPLFEASPNALERWNQKAWAMVDTLLTIHREPVNHGKLGRIAYKAGIALLDHPWARKKAKREVMKYVGRDTGTVCSFINAWFIIKTDLEREWFDVAWGQFEGRRVPIPAGYHEFLSQRYGNYMALPPESDRHGYHTLAFFDPDNSYEKYRGEKYPIGRKGRS